MEVREGGKERQGGKIRKRRIRSTVYSTKHIHLSVSSFIYSIKENPFHLIFEALANLIVRVCSLL